MIIVLAAFLVFIGIIGMIVHSNNMIIMMMCIELMFLGVQTCGVYIGYSLGYPDMYIWVLAVMTIAAVESTLGLAVVIMLYRAGGDISSSYYNSLRENNE